MNMLGCCFGTGPTRVAFGYGSAAASQPSASAGFSKGKSSSGAGGGRGGHSGNGADVKPFLQGKSANILPGTLSNYSSSLRFRVIGLCQFQQGRLWIYHWVIKLLFIFSVLDWFEIDSSIFDVTMVAGDPYFEPKLGKSKSIEPFVCSLPLLFKCTVIGSPGIAGLSFPYIRELGVALFFLFQCIPDICHTWDDPEHNQYDVQPWNLRHLMEHLAEMPFETVLKHSYQEIWPHCRQVPL